MGIFSKLRKTEREFAPLMYYGKDEPLGEFLAEDEISKDIAKNIILFCQRLHEMGILPEEEIVRFTVKGMIDMLVQWEVIEQIEIPDFDIAQAVFGKEYSGMWYRDKEEEPYRQYLVPHQIVLYHSKRKENYYLSLLSEGLDLCKNNVSVSDKEASSKKIGKGKKAKLNPDEMKQLKAGFSVLFMYLKYRVMINSQKLGYITFIEQFPQKFHITNRAEEFIAYAKQYFLLNSEKKGVYHLAHSDFGFAKFIGNLSYVFDVGMDYGKTPFKTYFRQLEEIAQIKLNKQNYESSFELLAAANQELEKVGKTLYVLSSNEENIDDIVLIGNENYELGDKIGLDIIKFDSNLEEKYCEIIESEKNIRELGREFYENIGVKNIEDFMSEIKGNCVLDGALYHRNYILSLDYYEYNILDLLYDFFHELGLTDLAEKLNGDDKTIYAGELNEYNELDEISGYDQVIAYAEEIRKRGKLLVYLETEYDYYEFVLIEDSLSAKNRFIIAADKVVERGELISYSIFD